MLILLINKETFNQSDSVTGMFLHFFTQKSFTGEVGTNCIPKNFQSPTQSYKA